VAVEKFARYFDVEMKVINVKRDGWVMDPREAVEACDENTIAIFTIVGTTYTGHFEDVKGLNDLLDKKNRENE
jgi:glutamate decarboxylase